MYRARLLKKMQLKNNAELTHYAFKHNLLGLSRSGSRQACGCRQNYRHFPALICPFLPPCPFYHSLSGDDPLNLDRNQEANMAEPSDKINLNNPSEVARETLRRLAMRRLAPTPDNYQTLYEEIAAAPTAAPKKSQHPQRQPPYWPDWSWTSTSPPPARRSVEHSTSRSARATGRWAASNWGKSAASCASRRKEARQCRVGPPADNQALLRDLLAKTLEFGVAPQLSHTPQLAEKASNSPPSSAMPTASLRCATPPPSLKSLWVSIELQGTDTYDQQEMLKRILLLLVENIGELLEDDTWLRGQLDMVQEVISRPDGNPVAAGS